MSGSITIAPYATSAPQDSFLLQTQGYIQGVAYDDPTARLELMGGYLASTETVVMWGGVPITEVINLPGTGADGIGPALKRSTSQANTTAWSVFNQAGSMIIGPGNTVPVAGTLNYVPFFRYGSLARIAVQADPALAAAVSGEYVSQPALYWDTTNYRITLTTSSNFALPAGTKLLSINSNSKIVSYNSGTGAVTWTTGSAAIIQI